MPDIQQLVDKRLGTKYWIDALAVNKKEGDIPSFRSLFGRGISEDRIDGDLQECEQFVKDTKSVMVSFNGFPLRCDLIDFFGDSAIKRQVNVFAADVGMIYFLRPKM
jgi:hypothetical protein